MRYKRRFNAIIIAMPVVFLAAAEAQACQQWSVDGTFNFRQSNGFYVQCTMHQMDGEGGFFGTCFYSDGYGNASGAINQGRFNMVVGWSNGAVGDYTGFVLDNGAVVDGRSYDRSHPASWAGWWNEWPLRCTR